jgi:aryl-alcohol dehydrogenase-like predicted oxidoreductase
MRQRRWAGSHLESSELGLGTWGLSGDGYGPVAELEQDRVIERALALGIRLFDTSDSYAEGQMEQRLGRLVPDDEQHTIVTKIGTCRNAIPPRKLFDPRYLREAFERCRERLRRQVIGAVLLHNPSVDTLERGEASGLLKDLKSKATIRAWGASVTSGAAARAALAQGAEAIELPFNAFYNGPLHELQNEIRDKAAVLAHSVLAYGMLCGHWSSDKEFPYEDHRRERCTVDDFRRRIRQLDALRPAVGGEILGMRAVALRYVLAHVEVSCAILGPRSSLQLDQLVREAGREPPYLTDEKRFALDARLKAMGVST